MNILYASVFCSKRKYNELFSNAKVKPLQQDQKYHGTLVDGLGKNNNNVTAITALPIAYNYSSKKIYKCEKEVIDNIAYIYLPFINVPILRHIYLFLFSFINTIRWSNQNSNNKAIICDVLDISISSGALLASKIKRIKSVGIVTDVPGFLVDNSKKKKNILKKLLLYAISKINLFILGKFDSYVFLTDYMNDLLNNNKKKYVVIEGQVDINMQQIPNPIENKYDKKVCMYAGSLKRIYGIKALVDAFLSIDIPDAELHIYGSGNFEDDLFEICNSTNKIKYFGSVSNDIVVSEQIKATLLINPRPSNEEYTKYSFPSKNMEYMASGTPMLTTKLPGMPKEYYDYVYLIEDESKEGIASVLSEILSLSKEELHSKGMKGKEFVLSDKNNVVQAGKLLRMINELVKGEEC